MKMKLLMKLILIIGILFALSACSPSPASPGTASNDNPDEALYGKRIDEYMAKMTLKEKVGQMTQLDASFFVKKDGKPEDFDVAILQKAIVDYGIGSVLFAPQDKPSDPSPKNWIKMVSEFERYAQNTPNHIPLLLGIDSVHGFHTVTNATIYPHNLGVAATWNVALAREEAITTATEMTAVGLNWNFAPVLDVSRDPRWGRTYETFGEDPYLVAQMGSEMVRGYQADGQVAATAKHFVAYSASNNGMDRQPVDISERTLREIHLPPYEAAIAAGLDTVMVDSGEVNGLPGAASSWLLKNILRDDLGFTGFAVSDFGDVTAISVRHKVGETKKDGIEKAFRAGLDMNMVATDLESADMLLALVNEKRIDEERINQAVRRILLVKFKLGLFESIVPEPINIEANASANKIATTLIGDPKSKTLARQLATQSITLLKNESETLPLSKKLKRILVAGVSADSMPNLCGGWSYNWAGALDGEVSGKTILQAIRGKVSTGTKIEYAPDGYDEKALKKSAASADVCIAVVGEAPYAETQGDLPSLSLSEDQQSMLQTLVDSSSTVIVVFVSGRPLVDMDWADSNAAGVIWAYLPGNEGAAGIADVLFGDFNPAGHLPITVPTSVSQLPLTYNSRLNTVYEPLYPFGYGLSYTTFNYSKLTVAPSVQVGASLEVTVTVKNTGRVAGDDVAQLYLSDVYASVTRPTKLLKGFARVSLAPGASQVLHFRLTPPQLSLLDENLKWVEEPRTIKLQIEGLESTVKIT
ncbi:MAG: glycoside hydrolase family 3 N-terminal domain-containing protein [Clostridia bacterium]